MHPCCTIACCKTCHSYLSYMVCMSYMVSSQCQADAAIHWLPPTCIEESCNSPLPITPDPAQQTMLLRLIKGYEFSALLGLNGVMCHEQVVTQLPDEHRAPLTHKGSNNLFYKRWKQSMQDKQLRSLHWGWHLELLRVCT